MEKENGKLEPSGIGYIRMMAGTVLGHAVTFFLFSWRTDIAGAWVYYALMILLNALNVTLLLRYNPQLLNERGKRRRDINRAERVIVPLMLAFTYVFPSAVAGLEWGLGGGFTSPACIAAGVLLLLVSGLLENWAMLVNRHFEKNIRIQSDREHAVVSSGPYRFVRHPGYLSYILRLIAFPLLVGSVYSVLPVAVGIAVHVVRTAVEDGMLKRELKGYLDYAEKTRYRLVPYIW